MFIEENKKYIATLRRLRGRYDRQTNIGIEKLIMITKEIIQNVNN